MEQKRVMRLLSGTMIEPARCYFFLVWRSAAAADAHAHAHARGCGSPSTAGLRYSRTRLVTYTTVPKSAQNLCINEGVCRYDVFYSRVPFRLYLLLL